MSQVSKYPITQNVYNHIFDVFLTVVSDLNTKKSVSEFFEEFLTPTERIMFAKRLAIGLLLAKKYDYHQISRILRVSTTTVGNVSSRYKFGKSYRQVIEDLLKDEENEKFWLKLGEEIASVGSIGNKGTSGWRYLKQELKNKRLKKPF